MNLLELAISTAEKAHSGQTRWDGSPYIEHPRRVMNTVKEWAENYNFNNLAPINWILDQCDFQNDIEVLLAAAIYHDVCEDSKQYEFNETKTIFQNSALSGPKITKFLDTVYTLTRQKEQNYCKYIHHISKPNNYISRIVKLADLQDNLSDLKPGSRRDKYELAQYILLN